MTPVEELRAAATKLRETATRATAGPWVSLEHGDRLVHLRNDGGFEYVVDEPMSNAANADWIALASPALAEPLAALLDDQVGIFETFVDSVAPDFAEHIALPALRVARLINGGGS